MVTVPSSKSSLCGSISDVTLLGYYADWHPDVPPAKVPYTRYTHLVHAFALLDSKGALTPPKAAAEFCRRAKAAKSVPLVAIGGAESGAAFLAANTQALADAIVRLVETAGYAGVDIDWEFPDQPGAPQKLVALAQLLRKRLPTQLLTAAVPGSDWYGKHYDSAALLPLLDWVNIMAYDFSGPWTAEAGHNAPLSFCKSALRYWTEQKRWPQQKLLLGLAAYGRGFRASRFGEKTTGKSAHEEVPFNEIARLEAAGWKRLRDSVEAVPYLVAPQGNELISFDDAESITKKVALAKASGVRGCFFWELSDDDGSLAAAAQKAWR